MRIVRGAALALCALFICATQAPASRADNWNKKTTVTFAEDVQISTVMLPAGTYVFQLADFTADRNIVQIWNANEDHLLATILTTNAQQLEPATQSVFEFEEIPGSSRMALKYWFYPGDTIGQEFAHPSAHGK